MGATVAKKFAKRYLKPADWTFKGNLLVGTEWSVAGSKKDSFYTVAPMLRSHRSINVYYHLGIVKRFLWLRNALIEQNYSVA